MAKAKQWWVAAAFTSLRDALELIRRSRSLLDFKPRNRQEAWLYLACAQLSQILGLVGSQMFSTYTPHLESCPIYLDIKGSYESRVPNHRTLWLQTLARGLASVLATLPPPRVKIREKEDILLACLKHSQKRRILGPTVVNRAYYFPTFCGPCFSYLNEDSQPYSKIVSLGSFTLPLNSNQHSLL